VNRVVTDQLSSWLFCPSRGAAENLAAEGVTRGVHVVGDVMRDQLEWAAGCASASRVLETVGVRGGEYVLATLHRAGNVDDQSRLTAIVRGLDRLDERVIFPVHPRTRAALDAARCRPAAHVSLVDPAGYVDMIRLQQGARAILTDSGGVQKEAYWLGVPCITVRDETEWTETVAAGWNVLAGADPDRIVDAVRRASAPAERPDLYGDTGAAARIVERLS
jgi:UDP-GlcNAc3NAcA epimerase